ncbi:MAG: DUF5818 domain-containing protein [Bryobacteraceae bacterium]|nr:DUF5818 domain-containing protein [Bryobacteraceae bacterium]MCX7605075.1 DUF5818 domain-containing protein [Bryobacteraceae bacterium]
MKKLMMMAAPALLLAQSPARVYTGVITDTMCGADHAHMGIQPDEKCVRECVKSGKWKYALIDEKGRMMVLSDQQTPEKYAAKRVKIRGVYYEKTGILRVDSIEPAR